MPSGSAAARVHVNSLGSIWYGLFTAVLQAHLSLVSLRRCLKFLAQANSVHPELLLSLALVSFAFLLIPFLLIVAVIKFGNLANDGFKLGRNLSTCTRDPASSILVQQHDGGVCRRVWQHGGPTAPFLHIIVAFTLLLSRLVLDARLIQLGIHSKDFVWKTDLDPVLEHRERLVVLNFFTVPPLVNNSSSLSPIPLPQLLSESHDFANDSGANSDSDDLLRSFAPEFINYGFALAVYAARYPAVFWNTNKCWSLLFSLQLFVNGLHSLATFPGLSVLYKLQIVGIFECLPSLRKSTTLFLLDGHVTLGLMILTKVLMLASSLVLYLYGLNRLETFIRKSREKRVVEGVSYKKGAGCGGGPFAPHCGALSVLIALAASQAPLLNDLALVYQASLDGAVLVALLVSASHLLCWVFLWLVLTLKRSWVFRLRVTIGRAAVRSARSIRLVTDVDLISSKSRNRSVRKDGAETPLLVVGAGRTFTVADESPKKAILNVVQKVAMAKRARSPANGGGCTDDDTDIYWLRPKTQSPSNENWTTRGKDIIGEKSIGRRQPHKTEFEDDGDYATLRVTEDETKLLERALQDESITYVSSRDLKPLGPPSPPPPGYPPVIETPEPPPPPPPPTHQTAMPPSSANDSKAGTPRCLRRADSGLHGELTPPRSGSVSSSTASATASASPPESSSGVHSNGSSRRAPSLEDLAASTGTTTSMPPPPPPSSSAAAVNVPTPTPWSKTNNTPSPLAYESTVVIRRTRPLTAEIHRPLLADGGEETFGRATNIRMTSFTDDGFANATSTLPHFPSTQLVMMAHGQQCSTLPHLPVQVLPTQGGIMGPRTHHTTIPTHLNGVRLFPAGSPPPPPNKRFPALGGQ